MNQETYTQQGLCLDTNKLINAMNCTYAEQNFTPLLICTGNLKTLLSGDVF